MQIQPPTALVVQRAEAGDALLLGVVQLGGVLDTQHPRVLAQALFSAGDMRREHRLGGNGFLIEQAVGGTCLTPTVAGAGNTQRRFLSQGFQQLPGTPIEPTITHVDRGQLRGQRTHRTTPSAVRKSPVSGWT